MSNVSPQPPDLAGVIRDLKGRVDSLERAPVAVAGPHRVVVGASGSTLGYVDPLAQTPPWRPFTACTFTDLWVDTTAPTTGLVVEMFVNDASVGSVTFGTWGTTGRASMTVTVDVFDRVDFRITSDPGCCGPPTPTWKGLCVQALGTSNHPVSAWLTFIEAGGVD